MIYHLEYFERTENALTDLQMKCYPLFYTKKNFVTIYLIGKKEEFREFLTKLIDIFFTLSMMDDDFMFSFFFAIELN